MSAFFSDRQGLRFTPGTASIYEAMGKPSARGLNIWDFFDKISFASNDQIRPVADASRRRASYFMGHFKLRPGLRRATSKATEF